MTPELQKQLDFVLETQLGFYLRATMLMELFTPENIDEVMRRATMISPTFIYDEFIPFAIDYWLPRSKRISIRGEDLPRANIEAFRGWCRKTGRLGLTWWQRVQLCLGFGIGSSDNWDWDEWNDLDDD